MAKKAASAKNPVKKTGAESTPKKKSAPSQPAKAVAPGRVRRSTIFETVDRTVVRGVYWATAECKNGNEKKRLFSNHSEAYV